MGPVGGGNGPAAYHSAPEPSFRRIPIGKGDLSGPVEGGTPWWTVAAAGVEGALHASLSSLPTLRASNRVLTGAGRALPVEEVEEPAVCESRIPEAVGPRLEGPRPTAVSEDPSPFRPQHPQPSSPTLSGLMAFYWVAARSAECQNWAVLTAHAIDVSTETEEAIFEAMDPTPVAAIQAVDPKTSGPFSEAPVVPAVIPRSILSSLSSLGATAVPTVVPQVDPVGVSGTAATEVEEALSPVRRDAVALDVGLASPVQWAATVFTKFLDPHAKVDLPPEFAGFCTGDEVNEARSLAFGEVSEDTRGRQSRFIKKWESFLAFRDLRSNPFLEGYPTVVRSTLVIVWLKQLKSEGSDFKAGFRALRRMFVEYEKEAIAGFLDSDKVTRAGKALAFVPRSESFAKRSHVKIPATPEIYWATLRHLDSEGVNALLNNAAHKVLGTPTVVTWKGRKLYSDGSFKHYPLGRLQTKRAADCLMFAAACTFEFGVGARISEVGYTGPRKQGAKNHAILTREVRFHLQGNRIVFSWELGEHVRGLQDLNLVQKIEFNQDSAKNNQKSQPRDGVWMRSAGVFEAQAMDLLIRFALSAGHTPVDTRSLPTEGQLDKEEQFFSRYLFSDVTGVKMEKAPLRFNRSHASTCIKDGGEMIGLPRQVSSTHSWRRGTASNMFNAGVDPAYINRQLGWKSDMSQVYQWSSDSQPTLFRTLGSSTLTAEVVAGMIPSHLLPVGGEIQINRMPPPGVSFEDPAYASSESDNDEGDAAQEVDLEAPFSETEVFSDETLTALDYSGDGADPVNDKMQASLHGRGPLVHAKRTPPVEETPDWRSFKPLTDRILGLRSVGLSTLSQRIVNEDCITAYEALPADSRDDYVASCDTPAHMPRVDGRSSKSKKKGGGVEIYWPVFKGVALEGDRHVLSGKVYREGERASGLVFTSKAELLKRVIDPVTKKFYPFAKFLNYEITSLDEAKAVACWFVHFGPAYSAPEPTIEGYRGVRFEGGRPGYVCPDEASANFYARDIHLSYTVTPIGSVSLTKFKNFEAARAWAKAPVAPVPQKDGSPDPTRRVDTNFVNRPSVFPLTRDFTLQDIGGLRSFQHIVSR